MGYANRRPTLEEIRREQAFQSQLGRLSPEQQAQMMQSMGAPESGIPKAPSTADNLKNTAINAGKSYAIKEGTKYIGSQIASQLGAGATVAGAGAGTAGAAGAGAAGTAGMAALAVPLAVAAAAYNTYDLWKNRPGRLEGFLRGGPAGFARSYMNDGYSKLEEDNRKSLMKQYGIDLGKTKEWENNAEFARTRDEKFLRPEDIDTAADWYMKFGPQYGSASDAVKQQLAQEAINRGILRERNGGIEIETDEEGGAGYEDWAKGLLAQPTAPAQGSRSRRSEPKKEKKEKPARQIPLSEIMPSFTYKPQVQDRSVQEAAFKRYMDAQTERANRRI